MPSRMLKFVSVDQRMPDKRDAAVRREDFDEIYREFDPGRAADQAARCSQCGVPFCQVHCPLHNNIPDWLMLTAEGRLEEAYELAQATNNLPEICGRICPQDRLCEGNCVIEQAGHGTVTIGSVERYITETAWERGWVKPVRPPRELEASVGIIGAGPAGLAAAEELRRRGYRVDIYDRYDRVGGLLVYGIPNFKLEKDVVARRAKLIAEAGVTFHLNFEVGRDATLQELRQRHAALLIATGVYKGRDIKVPGAGLAGVVPALDYLTASNRQGLGDQVPAIDDGTLDTRDKHVVVVGGGDTGMDCVSNAMREGAKQVRLLDVYPAVPESGRYDFTPWPMQPRRLQTTYALEEGGEREFGREVIALEGEDGHVARARARRVTGTSSRTLVPVPDSEYTEPADLVLIAIGFTNPEHEGLLSDLGVDLDRRGNVKAGAFKTSVEDVYAAGDVRVGASLVVTAIAEGRRCARVVDRALRELVVVA